MKRTAKIAATIAIIATPVFAANAGGEANANFFESAFANAQDGTPCYGRTYDDAHLKDHPQQTVKRIEIDMLKANADGVTNTAERFELGFAMMLTRSTEWYGQAAICKADADSADCFIEGDGGRFKLTKAGDGALKLQTGDYGIALEGASDFASLSGTAGDDREFVLKTSHEECEAAADSLKPNAD